MEHRREIDGLRAVAVLAVMLFHAGFPSVAGGFVGVDVFFVISGYLITSIILAERAAGTFRLAGFYERRARRILPALFFVCLACVPFAWTWLLPDQLEDFSKSLLYALFFASNLYFARDTGYFAAAAEEKPLLHTWSLAIEEQYYLFFPLLLAALSRLGRRGRGLGLAIVGVASLALAQRWSAAQPEQTFFATPARIWELMLGSGLAVGLPPAWTLGRRTREAGAALGLAAILFAVLRFDARTPSPSAWMLVPALGTAGVLVFASPQTGVGRLLGSAPFVAVGLVSYSAYLWHQPLLAFARARSATALSDLEKLALLGAALGLAALSWRALEQPFRDRRRVGRRRLARAVSVGAASLFAAALAGDLSDGFEARYAERWAAVRSDLDARRAERDALIRAGECHFNGRGAHGEIDAFLDGWSRESCGFDARLPSLEKLPYVVVGDSHAADVVMALKANGHVPLEMSGAGCSLVPSRMSASCRRQFEQLRRALAEDREYTHLVLVNRFTPDELSVASAREMLAYWSGFGRRLVFLTAQPEFANFKGLLLSGEGGEPDLGLARLSERQELLDLLARQGALVVHTRELFCAIAPGCGFRDERGELLLIDGHHFTRRGAELFGQRLLDALQQP